MQLNVTDTRRAQPPHLMQFQGGMGSWRLTQIFADRRPASAGPSRRGQARFWSGVLQPVMTAARAGHTEPLRPGAP